MRKLSCLIAYMYFDKTSLRLLQKGLEIVRLMEYYDVLCCSSKKLPLVANQIVITHKADTATLLNEEVRVDALYDFSQDFKSH